jgi:polyhydroxybutyrate depolymerase
MAKKHASNANLWFVLLTTVFAGCSSSGGGGGPTGGKIFSEGGSSSQVGTGGGAGTGGLTGSGGLTVHGATGGAGIASSGGAAIGAGGAMGNGGGVSSGGSSEAGRGGGAAGRVIGTGGRASGGTQTVGGAGGRGSTPVDGGPSGTGGARGGTTGSQGGAGGATGTACTTSTLKAGNSTRNLTVGGTQRSYILHVPSSYTGSQRVPLVLDFHALGGTGSQEQSGSGYQAVADKVGFLIAFPNGIDNAWNIGPCCTSSRDVDDLGFAKAIIADVAGVGCVDAKRVYSTGVSMGGGMSHYLACSAADLIAAVTPAAFDLLVPEEEPCSPSRPIAVLAFRGTADTVVPYNGGKGSSGRITFLGAQASFSRWAEIDSCVEPTTTDGECKYYKQCAASVEVGLCVKQGGGHAAGDAQVGWSFLSRFSLP